MKKNLEPAKIENYWSWSEKELLDNLGTNNQGLTQSEVTERKKKYGLNQISTKKSESILFIFWKQIKNPLYGILFFAALVSLATQSWSDASIILAIIFLSAVLGFLQEFRASKAVKLLLAKISHTVTVRRAREIMEVPATEVVPGDIILLNAGTMIPADGVLIQCKDLFVNQAVLTGESMPAEKSTGSSPAGAPLNLQNNAVFSGTSVRSGVGEMVAVRTGAGTHFGQVATSLDWRDSETDFEKGLKDFGYLLSKMMIAFVLIVLVGNVWFHKPWMESLFFSLALAVGLSPELLPAILTVTLAKGAIRMAKKGVIVRRLNCIESLGNMNVLCCDKTGTLTEGRVTLKKAVDLSGVASNEVARWAYLNSFFQTGIKNSLDTAILEASQENPISVQEYKKIDEIPYDFIRRRLTIILNYHDATLMLTKGAAVEVLGICQTLRSDHLERPLREKNITEIIDKVSSWGSQGYRVLAVASRSITGKNVFTAEDEKDFCLEGFLLFEDPPHPDAKESLLELKKLGVQTKIITGDSRFVALSVAKSVGFEDCTLLTGQEINELSHDALLNRVESTSIFAEIDPQQKETIVQFLKKRSYIVGFMGDGINDAPALMAADVGISVESAVDVAKEAADLVLTRHDLKTVIDGIFQGRITFANTLKYIFITTSANFGNMISMAVASLFLPFLPLLATQVLLNNLLSDIPALSIGTDYVDQDWSRTPHRWSLDSVRRFMIGFGLISSIFDILIFVLLLYVFRVSVSEFQTAWFAESLLTEVLVIFVVRTFRPAFKSRPSLVLVLNSIAVLGITLLLLISPLRTYFGFATLPLPVVGAILAVSGLYILTSEVLKPFIMKKSR